MQPIAPPSLTLPAPAAAVLAGSPLPVGDGGESLADPDACAGGLAFAWFFAAALQAAPVPGAPVEPSLSAGDEGGAGDGNVLPLPATPPVVLPLAVPLQGSNPLQGAAVAAAATGGSFPALPQGPVSAGPPGVPAGAAAPRPGAQGPGTLADPAGIAAAAQAPTPVSPSLADPEPLEVEDPGAGDRGADREALALAPLSRQGPPALASSRPAEAAGLPQPVHDPRWTPALAERLVWMVEGEVKHAELRLNPPELGPLEVRIAMVDDEARITFSAPHASVREALEAALPRLREILGGTGVNLVQVDVSGQGAGHRPAPDAPGGIPGPSHALSGRAGAGEAPAALGVGTPRQGLFDAYA